MTNPLTIDDYDVDDTPVTDNFALTRIGSGESYDKNGYAFGDSDRVKIDKVLHALARHEHTGAPALGDPSDAPDLTSTATGGHLAPSTSYYYRIAFVDKWGLETAASPEASITTPDPIDAPSAAAASVEPAGGTLPAGAFSYVIAVTDAYGGETSASTATDVNVPSGTTNRVRLELPDLPDGASSFAIYRARPGQNRYYQVGATTSSSWYDDGNAEDQTVTAPLLNSTNATNSVTVAIASGVIPQGCVAWRIYRSDASGIYDGDSLVHEVSEAVTETDTTPVTSWIDTGDALLQGFPQQSSSTLAAPSVITLDDIQGHLPLAALPRGAQCITATVTGALTDGETITITETPAPVRPTRFTAFFRTPPTGTVVLHAVDQADASIELPCSAADHRASDPAGYYRIGFPATDAGTYQAESGTRSSDIDVAIITDLAAVSGEAVELDSQGDWVQAEGGELDAGQYSSSVSLRALAGNAVAADLRIAAVRLDTGDELAAVTLDASPGFDPVYADYPGPTFIAPGGVPVALRVAKAGTSSQVYLVDAITLTPVVPVLQAGLIRIAASVTGGSGADANVALWF